jgi:uncharacterized membrane protein YoaK (UPF0700 family)
MYINEQLPFRENLNNVKNAPGAQKWEIFMKDLERHIHLNMALIGGFIGGYAILNHNELFGSAQTSNMITLALEIAGKDRYDFLIRLIGLFIYIAGLSCTVLVTRFFSVNKKLISVSIDAIALIAVALIPETTNDFVALYPLFFATAFQWCSFSGAEGFNSASIFSTNNLRQFVTSLTEYLFTRDEAAHRKWKLYGKVLFFFHLGVVISYISSSFLGLKSSFICLIPIVSATALILKEQYAIEAEHKLSYEQ